MFKPYLILLIVFLQFKLATVYGQGPKPHYLVTINGTRTQEGKKLNRSSLVPLDIPSTITQPPQISYQTPQNYVINTSIAALTPSNSGGSIPATVYGQASVYGATYFGTATGIAVSPLKSSFWQEWKCPMRLHLMPMV